MTVKLLTEHKLEFLSLKGGCIGSSEGIQVKMPHCWKSNALVRQSLCIVAVLLLIDAISTKISCADLLAGCPFSTY